jgi:ankyrin repeat protein
MIYNYNRFIKLNENVQEWNEKLLNYSGKGNLNGVKECIENGTDVNCKDHYGWTPLIVSSRYGHLEIVKVLIENGADVNCKNNKGWTSLMFSSYKGYLKIVKTLIDNGADWNIKNIYNEDFVFYLSKKNKEIIIREYPEEYKKYLLTSNNKKCTRIDLINYIKSDDINMVENCLDQDSKMFINDRRILEWVIWRKNITMVDLFIKKGTPINTLSNIARDMLNADMLNYLLNNNSDDINMNDIREIRETLINELECIDKDNVKMIIDNTTNMVKLYIKTTKEEDIIHNILKEIQDRTGNKYTLTLFKKINNLLSIFIKQNTTDMKKTTDFVVVNKDKDTIKIKDDTEILATLIKLTKKKIITWENVGETKYYNSFKYVKNITPTKEIIFYLFYSKNNTPVSYLKLTYNKKHAEPVIIKSVKYNDILKYLYELLLQQ